MKRLFSLLFCMIMFLTAISCAESKESDDNNTTALTEETTANPNDRTRSRDSLPGDLDYEGGFVTVYSTSPGTQNNYIQGFDELTGDVVEDAVYQRNRKVEDRLNCVIEYYLATHTYDIVASETRKVIQSGDNTYDLIIGGQFGLCQLAAEGMFINSFDNEYLDFDQPWWWSGYMEEISIGHDKRFFLVGDYFLDMLFGARVLFFNKVIYENFYGDPNDLYAVVLDGSWTMDKMTETVKAAYHDLNGNGQNDEPDKFGYVTYLTYSSVDAFVFATDVKLTTRDDKGLIELNIVSERAVMLAEKLLGLFYNEGSYIYPAGENTAKFITGQALFLGNSVLSTTASLRDMTDDFGMIPYPKLDEIQKKYGTLIHDTMNLGVFPITTIKFQMTGAVLEALSAESYRSVIPAYYETALKVKYTRDELSAQMIDIIHDSIQTDFAFVYYAALNNAGMIYRTTVTGKSSDLASTYAGLEKGAQKALDKLITAYTENT